MRKYYIAAVVICLAAIASYAAYYYVTKDGSADQAAMEDIQQLQEKISGYTQIHKQLPISLGQLDLAHQKVAARLGNYTFAPVAGPGGNEGFGYQICADFKTVQAGSSNNYSSEAYFDSTAGHLQGRQCFKLKTYSLNAN